MSRQFLIHNRSELEAQRLALPVIQHLSRIFGSGCSQGRVVVPNGDVVASDAWIILRNSRGGGFGVDRGDYVRGFSPLHRKLDLVRAAHLILSSFHSALRSELELAFEAEPPRGWTLIESGKGIHSIRYALGPPFMHVGAPASQRATCAIVGVRIFAELPPSVTVLPKGVLIVRELLCFVPELGVCGYCTSKGGDMEVTVKGVEDIGEQKVPGVRLDLGEIEVSLSELVGLRPGVALNLGAVKLERCFVRLGSTTLAEGVFSSRGADLLLTIEAVNSQRPRNT